MKSKSKWRIESSPSLAALPPEVRWWLRPTDLVLYFSEGYALIFGA
ncbi:MAG TPA: hypothetical protein VGN90_06460 [Pyrinomonadaceae bacterium]|nr:hypothetical protein [Pyrinomonadaceae bacterium]